MPFDTGIPPPKSNYTYAQLGVAKMLDVALDDGGSDEESAEYDKWMCSSMADVNVNDTEPEPEQVNNGDLQGEQHYVPRFTAQEWLDQIESKYFDERDDLVSQCLQAALNNVDDPYTLVLHIIYKAFFDLYSKRVPITYRALDELDIWCDLKKQNNQYVPEPSVNSKCQAMEFICRNGYNYLDKTKKVFELDQKDNSFLSSYVQLEQLKSKKLKEIVTIIYTLNLQSCFESSEIMLPLIANDQIQILETYIGEDASLRHEYIQFLNDICGMKEEDLHHLVREKGLKVKDPSKIQNKTLVKIAEKAVKKYNLKPEDFPKIFQAKNLGSLQYLLRKKFKEERNCSSEEAIQKWDDLIKTAVSGNVWLQEQLIYKLVDMNEVNSAMLWAKQLGVPPHKLPLCIRNDMTSFVRSNRDETLYHDNYNDDGCNDVDDYEDNHDYDYTENIVETYSSKETPIETEDWETEIDLEEPRGAFSLSTGFTSSADELEEDYHTLALSNDDIVIVDTVQGLVNSMHTLFKSGQIIGFDAEWKSTMCKAGEQDRVSILQLAIQNKVFIIDIFKFYLVHSAQDVLKEFFRQFFTSKDVIKIGYGITGDLKILMGMFAYMKDFVLASQKLVDLCEISQKMFTYPQVTPYLYPARKAAIVEKGLSLLINRTLGRRLNKTFQVSDWEKRPLSKEQIQYAALDAFCLLEVFTFLQTIVNNTKIKVELTENLKLKWLKPKRNNNKRKDKYEKGTNKAQAPDNTPLFKGPPRPLTSFKVICDTMLQGLGRQLRICGVDTLLLNNLQDHSSAVQISHRDNRVILTSGKPYFELRGYVPDSMCMWVPNGTLLEQVKMVFTRYNIALLSKDILSRCKFCNCDKYLELQPDEVKLAFYLKHDLDDVEMPETQHTESGSINLSNFTIKNGVELQLDFISPTLFERVKEENTQHRLFETVDVFNVCEQCGKIYWEGGHHSSVKNNFAELIDKRETDKTYYGTPG